MLKAISLSSVCKESLEDLYLCASMEDLTLQKTVALIAQDFELEAHEQVLTEEALLQLLSDQIAYLIDHKLEFLLSLMYRLDIDENKVNRALSPFSEEPANVAIAKLVLNRQKQRVFTKEHYKQESLDNWEWD